MLPSRLRQKMPFESCGWSNETRILLEIQGLVDINRAKRGAFFRQNLGNRALFSCYNPASVRPGSSVGRAAD